MTTICQRRGSHDWGNGPGNVNRLNEGEEQTCVDCKSRRTIKNGNLKYLGRLTVEERN